LTPIGKYYYNLSLFNRYGLYHDDVVRECFNPEVMEALRRVPKDVYDGRIFRQVRADQLEITKSYLPKEEWITPEDPHNYYLQPYIDEVLAEWKEKKEWEQKYPQ
jgi:ubiquinol-cytochrome c reductase subunit 7